MKARRPAPRPSAPSQPATTRLIPNDHLRLLIQLLQPAGPELARRWLAALLLVHRQDRESVVSAVEKRLADLYPLDQYDQLPAPSPTRQAASTHAPGRRRHGRLSA